MSGEEKAKQKALNVVNNPWWDIIIPAGIGFILILMQPELQKFWATQTYPTGNVCLHIPDIVEGLFSIEGLLLFAAACIPVYAFTKGRRDLLRVMKITAFIGVCLDYIIGIHLPSGSNQIWPAGFEIDLVKFLGATINYCLGIPVILLILGGIASFLLSPNHESTTLKISIMFLSPLAFLEMLWASLVVKWFDMSLICFFGGLASTFEGMIVDSQVNQQYEEEGYSYKYRFQIWAARIGLLVFEMVVGIWAWQTFLAAWGINPFC